MDTNTSVCAVLVATHKEAAKASALISKWGINRLARESVRASHHGAPDSRVMHLSNKGDPCIMHKKAARRPLLKLLIAIQQ